MGPFNSYFVTPASARQAVELCLPMIEAAMQSKFSGEGDFLYIVIMKPGFTPDCARFDEAILYEHAIGDREQWDADYDSFARSKAHLSWRTGLDSHVVQESKPHLLSAGDTVLWGSVVVDGIVVGVSGADPWFDEAFAGAIAMTLRALAKKSVAGVRKSGLFLPGAPQGEIEG